MRYRVLVKFNKDYKIVFVKMNETYEVDFFDGKYLLFPLDTQTKTKTKGFFTTTIARIAWKRLYYILKTFIEEEPDCKMEIFRFT